MQDPAIGTTRLMFAPVVAVYAVRPISLRGTIF